MGARRAWTTSAKALDSIKRTHPGRKGRGFHPKSFVPFRDGYNSRLHSVRARGFYQTRSPGHKGRACPPNSTVDLPRLWRSTLGAA